MEIYCAACAVVGSVNQARAYCRNCGEYYCIVCSQYHTRFKISADHVIVTGSAVPTTKPEQHLYENDPERVFDVEVVKTDVSRSCGLRGRYGLHISESKILLLSAKKGDEIYDWPFSVIRRYGTSSSAKVFILEVGRMCASGEGIFHFKSDQYRDIYQVTLMKVKHRNIVRKK